MTHNPPALAPLPGLIEREHSFTSHDATELFYRVWHPGEPQNRGLVLFHGGHEHSGRFQELVESLALPGVSVFAWDARGHGRSPGKRGHARHFMDLVRDADAFIQHIQQQYGIPVADLAVLGHSVGSVILATWLLDYAPPVRAAVLGSPAFAVKLYVPFALPGLGLLQSIAPNAQIRSYVRPGMLTHDPIEAEARRRDPLISPQISVRVLTSLFDTARRVIDGAAGIHTPLLLLSAGRDRVVHQHAQQRFFQRLGSTDKHFETLPGFFHEVFHEQGREPMIQRVRTFLLARLGDDRRDDPAPAESNRERFATLIQPLPWYHPRRMYFIAVRGLLASLGRLSEGICLGWRHGFDSGPMLDYVYRNEARGITSLGRLIDRYYLDAPGWQGIRVRGQLLRDAIIDTSRQLRASGQSVHIVDVATGQGRYMMDGLEILDDPRISAVCRDQDETGLEAAQAEALGRGLHRISFERGDAFDAVSLSRLRPRPDIVVVSGLYELFEDNALIRHSLQAIHGALKPDGYLIVTNQPWHPQLEFIARVLPNRDGRAWVMRPRHQVELVGLLRACGFSAGSPIHDDAGIFNVTVARRQEQ